MTYYSTTITSKGQITLPAAFREKLGLVSGKKVTVELKGDKLVINAPVDIDALRAKIRTHMAIHHPKPLTKDEVEKAKIAYVTEKYFNGN